MARDRLSFNPFGLISSPNICIKHSSDTRPIVKARTGDERDPVAMSVQLKPANHENNRIEYY